LEYIFKILILLLKYIYTTLPAIFANMAPIIMKNLPFLKYPLDFNLTLKGERVLGDNKTFRGLFFGIIFSTIVVYIQVIIYKNFPINLSIIEYDKINYHLLGPLIGFGVIFGDAVKSFIKRRLKIKPGQQFMPWDQIDCALGGLLFGRIVWKWPIEYAITIIFITFFLHIGIRHVASWFGICEKW